MLNLLLEPYIGICFGNPDFIFLPSLINFLYNK